MNRLIRSKVRRHFAAAILARTPSILFTAARFERPSLCAISPVEKAFGEQLNDLTLTSPEVIGTHLHHGSELDECRPSRRQPKYQQDAMRPDG